MTTYVLTAAFTVECYCDHTIEADSPEAAIAMMKAMDADDGLWSGYAVDYGSATEHRVVSFLDPDQNPIIEEDVFLDSKEWEAL